MKNGGILEAGGLGLSALSLILGIILSGIIIVLCGNNPFEAYATIMVGAFGGMRSIANTLTQATPLIFTGLAFAITKKVLIINLGIEGQMNMGALGAAIVGSANLGLPAVVHLPASIMAGILFGAAYAALAGFLKVKFGSSEIIATIMLNAIALLFIGYLLNGPLLAEGSVVNQTKRIVEAAQLPEVFPQYRLSIAIFFAVAACVCINWFIERTTTGYEIHCVGLDAKASEMEGINISKIVIITLCISGAIAGMAGASHVLGVDRRLIFGFSPGYGFSGIVIAVLAANNPFRIILAGFIFGALRSGAMELNRITNIPIEFISVMQAVVVLLMSSPMLLMKIVSLRKKTMHPAAERGMRQCR